ncbi:Protein farnesyltransferase subunit beta [Babesia sp. Xinjiang]|uniref:Protein farnesyltransferase subunit beta n=1 Tax=Babesia sp. Xinjiang TaxID=462227 RepID=UPI000A2415BB|nr:Protein farnesyltransferase subunit beta [Babesia sp. Xinjiang]ORM40172.1 Protein farnesyltransferase subunit beta [Babesia sp. Xinjiang]
MSPVEERIIRRARGIIARLESCCARLDSAASPPRNATSGDCNTLSEDDASSCCKELGAVLAQYMINICKGCDEEEAKILRESVDASLQAQFLVELNCAEKYSSAFAHYLSRKDVQNHTPAAPHYDGRRCVSIAVESLTRYQPAQVVLSVLSDFSIDDGFVRIDVKNHVVNFLWKIGRIACEMSPLQRDAHVQYITKHLTLSGATKTIPLEEYSCSQPWVIYWSLHGMSLLGADILPYRERALKSLFDCWDTVGGGFGGGRGQMGHLATTYAAVSCLNMLQSLHLLNIAKLRSFLLNMKQPDGTFTVHHGGEVDVRGIYCAVASAYMAGILDEELSEGVASRIASCQGYDGGISGEPFLESHAGYVYCGTAALKILNSLNDIDTDRLRRWCRQRQTPELGFQGRPHKLVDVCYSFWISGTLELLNDQCEDSSELSRLLLKAYILCVSQSTTGGFRDKPSKPVDLYHTCYALSALEIISQPPGKRRIDCALNLLI